MVGALQQPVKNGNWLLLIPLGILGFIGTAIFVFYAVVTWNDRNPFVVFFLAAAVMMPTCVTGVFISTIQDYIRRKKQKPA